MKKNKGNFSQKHSPERKPNQEIVKAIKEKVKSGELTCAQAFEISENLNAPPGEVGFTADYLEIRISQCQLGLFGFIPVSKIVKPAESVALDLEKAIRDDLTANRLSCESSWKIAKRFRMAKIRVSSACEALNLKITSCPLGAF